MKRLLLIGSIGISIYSFVITVQALFYIFGPGFAFFSFIIFPITLTIVPLFLAFAYGYWMPLLMEGLAGLLYFLAFNDL